MLRATHGVCLFTTCGNGVQRQQEKFDPTAKTQPGWGPAIIAEIEMWANRIKVLESGDVAVFRIYGRKFDPSLK